MRYDLPTSVEVNGHEYSVRTDFRAVLDIFTALNDVELDDNDKAIVMLTIFYEDFDEIPPEDYNEAVKKCCEFIDMGVGGGKKKAPKLVDWEQDFNYIIAPINRIVGRDVRADAYMHWWTFLANYYEIGDCLFAQIVRVRSALAKGKKLDKADSEWYRENHDLVDFKTHYTEAENKLLAEWGGVNG